MGIKLLLAVVAVALLFELFEHVVLPVVAQSAARKRRPATGAEGMVGKAGRVISWGRLEGRVLVDGEIWRAECRDPLESDDAVVVRSVRGLTLEVTPSRSDERS